MRLLLLLLCFCFIQARAQRDTLTGSIIEASGQTPVMQASVLLLARDSAIICYTRSDQAGCFTITRQGKEAVLLFVSHPGYTPEWRAIITHQQGAIPLAPIVMFQQRDSLAEATVTHAAPITRLKGDTLEFSTGQVQLPPNATVEALLQRLSGVVVHADGSITINGQQVDRILVNGEDVFHDPKLITRNFNASLFSKLQVFDKVSDKTAFTGVDDGQRSHTLNLVVGEASQHGFFGKLEGGAGTSGYYNNTALAGSFRGSSQFAALGLLSNTGTTGFSGETGGSNEVASILISPGVSDGLNASAGTGVPKVAGAGLHYANRWDSGAQHTSANYSWGSTRTQPYTSSLVQQYLHDTIYLQQQRSTSTNTSYDQHAQGVYDIRQRSGNALRLAVSGSTSTAHNQLTGTDSTVLNGKTVNQGIRRILSNVSGQAIDGNLFYKRAIGAKGWQLSATAEGGSAQNQSSGYLYAYNRYTGSQPNDSTDQKKDFSNRGWTGSGNAYLTYQANPRTTISASYGVKYTSTHTLLTTYTNASEHYNEKVDSLSIDYSPSIFNQEEIVQVAYEQKGFKLHTGLGLHQTRLETYHYNYFNPHLFGHYNIDPHHVLYFSYDITQQLPSLEQLQPLKNNVDPLHLTVGNPGLKPSNSQNFAVRLLIARQHSLSVNVQGGIIQNGISSQTITDSLGRQVTRSVNVHGNMAIASYLSYDFSLPEHIDGAVNENVSYNRDNSFTGTLPATNQTYNGGLAISLQKKIGKGYLIQTRSAFDYTYVQSSINPATTNYLTQHHSASITLPLLWGMLVNSETNVTIQQPTGSFRQDNITTNWNIAVTKEFLDNQLGIQLKMNNLFNQNNSIIRTVSANMVSTTYTNGTTKRYVLASLIYHFRK